jgi:hypothetical protein
MISPGNKVKTYFQTPDGSMMELTAFVEEIQLQYGHDFVPAASHDDLYSWVPTMNSVEMTIKLRGISPLLETFGLADTRQHIQAEKKKSEKEWLCDWCGRPNAREKTTCGGCGGVRSFIYG